MISICMVCNQGQAIKYQFYNIEMQWLDWDILYQFVLKAACGHLLI